MKRFFYVFFVILFSVIPASAATYISEGWESGLGTWECYNGVENCSTGALNTVADGITPDPTYSLRFTYPQGFPDGNAPERVKKLLPNQTEVWSMYYFKYSSNWAHHNVMDKQLYITSNSKDLLMIFGIGWWGARNFSAENGPWVPDGWNRAYQGYTTIQWGRWYRVTIRVKLNTYNYVYDEPGCSYQCKRSDGVLQIWLKDMETGNETLEINKSNVCFRNTNETLDQWSIAPVWGGESGLTKPATDYFYVDKIIVSSTDPRNGGDDSSGGMSKIPDSPTNLLIN